jgi:hypothetical protein
MPEVKTDYKSYIIHIEQFKILVICTNYGIFMVTYNNKSIPHNTVTSGLRFYTEPCPDSGQSISDKYRFSSPAI